MLISLQKNQTPHTLTTKKPAKMKRKMSKILGIKSESHTPQKDGQT